MGGSHPQKRRHLSRPLGCPSHQLGWRRTADEAASAAREIGYPVALKAVGPEIVHKTDVGGVVLNIADEMHPA